MMATKFLISGARDFGQSNDEFIFIFDALSKITNKYDDPCIINGIARGVDSAASLFAIVMKYDLKEYPAEWKKYGRAAGPIRNKQMLDEGNPDFLIAFLREDSRGTANMIKQANSKKYQIPTKIIKIGEWHDD